MEVHSLHASPCSSFSPPCVKWSYKQRTQVDNGELKDKHTALGSELEPTQGLKPAPRLMGSDFCSTLYFARLIPPNKSL